MRVGMLAADLPQTRLIALFRLKNATVLLINTELHP